MVTDTHACTHTHTHVHAETRKHRVERTCTILPCLGM
uniref:Uncharacterized protein n=1 Tax=Anguilla anguilla TaxID=7936 RepID=A0A0E9US66_ANGAN